MKNKTKTLLKKTISWRIISTASTLGLAYLFIGSIEVAGALAAVDFIAKLVIYYTHEAFWSKHLKKQKMERIANESFTKAYRRIFGKHRAGEATVDNEGIS